MTYNGTSCVLGFTAVGVALFAGLSPARAAQVPQPTAKTSYSSEKKAHTQDAHPQTSRAGQAGQSAKAHRSAAAAARDPEYIQVNGQQRSPFGNSARQSVGASETHIDEQTIALHHVVSVRDLQALAPNLTIQPQGSTTNVNFYLRGVGFKDFTSNNTPSVMPYIDGVAVPLGYMAGASIFDVEGVDVVPGPAGFSHGQTVTGGEVNIVTNAPTSTFHAGASQDIASYNRLISTAYLSGPISSTLKYRIAGTTQHGGGFQINRYGGADFGNADKGALRGKLLWQPDERTDITFTGSWSQDNSEGLGTYNIEDLVSPILPPDRNNLMTGWGFRKAFTQMIGVKNGSKPFNNDTVWSANINANRDFGWAKLTSITAFQQMYIHNLNDDDSSNSASYDFYYTNNSNVFSHEMRLSSTDKNSPLDWVVGAYYDKTTTKASLYNDFSASPTRPYISDTRYSQNQEAFSQFARAGYFVLKNVKLTAGVSHESDDRELINMTTQHYGYSNNNYGNHGALTNEFAGMGGIEYHPLRHLLLYGNIRKGFKPGGFTANNTVIAAQLTPIKPESLLAYEAGLKTDFFHNRLRFNWSGFWYDYHGQQIKGQEVVAGYGIVGQYINVPKSTIWGTELEIDANPIPGLILSQHLGYERGNYHGLHFIDSAATYANFAKTGIYTASYDSLDKVDAGIPKLTLNGSASYRINVFSGWNLTPELDYSYRGSELDYPGNNIYRLPAYFLMNASLTLASNSGRWLVSVYSSNLLDRHYDLSRETGADSFYGVPGAPRFIGGRMAFNY